MDAQTAAIAEATPAIRPGIPCKLFTPQVSWINVWLKKGVKYWKPSVETMPATVPLKNKLNNFNFIQSNYVL